MIVLGINGGFDLPFEGSGRFDTGENHDSSAALLVDGEIKYAIEEERLNRIKHTNKFPFYAIKSVLKKHKIGLDQVDYLAVYATESYVESLIKKIYWTDPTISHLDSAKAYISKLFEKAFDYKMDTEKICFVDHHIAHASSSYYLSGFSESLVLTVDGVGENISGRVLYGKGNEMKCVEVIPEINSLGHYYVEVIRFIGYDIFDEYKVMGLAPYGDPSVYRDTFSLFYKLLPNGAFKLNREIVPILLNEIGKPRRKGQELSKVYKDVAAALQESLENIIMHIVSHHAQKTGYDNLCLAGGVSLNCSSNGKLLYSGLFKNIFVQPAAHDAGNSIGSAVYTYLNKSKEAKVKKLEHVFMGTAVEENERLVNILNSWGSFIEFEKNPDVVKKAAELIFDGKILGWVQGQSEFGPRALGNRSIIADPRPEKNKDIVNAMVKKREAFRPFAPSVMMEKVQDFFDVHPNGTSFDYMTFVVKVKEEYRNVLGAITHVDGTARIQTVNKQYNPKYWSLIKEFGNLSGIPMLLNTSFNNNVEPIVNTAEEAIVCFLTTGLDYLVIGDYLISKKDASPVNELMELVPEKPYHTVIQSKNAFDSFCENSIKYEIGFNYSPKYNKPISKAVFEIISQSDGKATLGEAFASLSNQTEISTPKMLDEIHELWKRRYIRLSPKL